MQTDILSELKTIREKKGGLGSDDLREIGEKHGKNLAGVYSVSTFYTETSPAKRGKYRINICRSLPCKMKGMEEILSNLMDELKIGPEGVTGDGLFSLHIVNCIGACDSAPAMLVNDELFGDLTGGKVRQILKDIRTGKGE